MPKPTMVHDVFNFHRVMGQPAPGSPATWPDDDRVDLRMSLIDEEINKELKVAVANRDMVETADAIADGIYVLIGMAIELGIPLEAVWDEVQRSNMAKAGGPRRADGKVLKPPGWTPPNIAGVLADHGYGTSTQIEET